MKRILLFVMTLVMVVGAVAQPPRGPQGPRGFRPHPGPRPAMKMKMVKLTDDEVAARFARTLRLDETKAEAFAPVLTKFISERATVNQMFPMAKPSFQHPRKNEKPSEEQIAEMKVRRAQAYAHHEAEFELYKDFRPRFLEVLNGRQYHRMMRVLNDPMMYVKFVRIENETEKVPELTAPESEGLANAIENVNSDKAESSSEWHSINGVTLKGQPTQSGIYIKDGKKVLVR